MNSIWILTIMLTGASGAAAVTTQEFTNEIACKLASVSIRNEYEKTWSTKDLTLVCSQK